MSLHAGPCGMLTVTAPGSVVLIANGLPPTCTSLYLVSIVYRPTKNKFFSQTVIKFMKLKRYGDLQERES